MEATQKDVVEPWSMPSRNISCSSETKGIDYLHNDTLDQYTEGRQ